jgi:hypothetical protein
VDIEKPFVGRFGMKSWNVSDHFRHDTKRSRNCSHSFRLRSLFSGDVMCDTDRQTDRQLFIIYMNPAVVIKENTSRHCSSATSRLEAHQRFLRAVRSCN